MLRAEFAEGRFHFGPGVALGAGAQGAAQPAPNIGDELQQFDRHQWRRGGTRHDSFGCDVATQLSPERLEDRLRPCDFFSNLGAEIRFSFDGQLQDGRPL